MSATYLSVIFNKYKWNLREESIDVDIDIYI